MNYSFIKKLILSVFMIFPLFSILSGELFEAKIYREGSNRQDFLFDYSNEISRDGEKLILAHNYYSPGGDLFAREEVVYSAGEFTNHKTEFYLLEEFSRLEKSGDQLLISFRRGDKIKSKEIKYPEGLVFGPTQQDFITENLDMLRAGVKLDFLLPVPEFTMTTAFTMVLDEETDYGKESSLVVRMETRNFLLRLIVGKNFFVIDRDSGLIQEIHGPSILQVYEKGKWNLVDVDIYFDYKD